jgi:hypothetical protein
MKTLTGLLLAVAIAVPAVVQAQDGAAPLTWVAYTKVKPGKTQDWVKAGLKYDKPILDKLVAEGAVLTWGYAVRASHRPGYEWTHLTWVTCPDWAGIGKWMGASMAAMAARSPEENAEAMASMELEKGGSHFDEVVRAGFASYPDAPVKFNFLYTGHFKTKPGKFADGTRAIEEAVIPIGDELKAAGAISGYGLHLQELHGQHQPGGDAWTHRTWYSFADLGTLDKLQAAFRARVTGENTKTRAATFEFDAHTDELLVVLHHEPAP